MSIKGSGKQSFSSKYFSYRDIQWEKEWREDSESVLQRQKKKQEDESLMRERQKVPLGPSSDLAPVKSISVTPGSQTWHGAISFPWLGCRYLPTIPLGHGASLSQLRSATLAFHIMSNWSLLHQRRADITLGILLCVDCRYSLSGTRLCQMGQARI